jgi:hypothetical protein
MLYPVLPVFLVLVLSARGGSPNIQQIVRRSVGTGLVVGGVLMIAVGQRSLFVYSCRVWHLRDSCCAARVLGASTDEAPISAPCERLSSVSCVRLCATQVSTRYTAPVTRVEDARSGAVW